ncbi:LysR family transcriptional regulator [Frankia sp. Ag45/Mut15]|uniref:LysR family transcriptional regulator n=1 Tax=Frankia umida TaxID=573489 RepID=A0ABT0JYR1_9ACTN|nr:LysR family transcriptional regulator [Frankia umida]MCK9876682.1 LysR family transcriptional regulator [Frankia umida]
MSAPEWSGAELEVRELRYFVAVAEELHFGRAAERLAMAQPPLSRAIRELERRLGARLLERTTRRVELTPAGQVLLRDARVALEAVTAAARRTRHAARPAPTLRVALKADYDAGMLPAILAAYREQETTIEVELLLGGLGEQERALRDGRADVALLPTPAEPRGLELEPVLIEPRLVALAAGDELATRATLSLADLRGRLLPTELPAASTPRDLAQIFMLVELGTIIWYPPMSLAQRHPRPGLVYRHVTDLAPATLCVAWPSECRSSAVAAFVRATSGVAAARAREGAPQRTDPSGGTGTAGPGGAVGGSVPLPATAGA